jgi:hypothetical protein
VKLGRVKAVINIYIYIYMTKEEKGFCRPEVTETGTYLIQSSDSSESQSWFGTAAEELKDTDSWRQIPRCCAT